jgi:hypothetical protein
MKWYPQKKWDGETNKAEVIKALIRFFEPDSQVMEKAKYIAYGDRAALMKKHYKTTHLCYDLLNITGMPQGININGMFKLGKRIDYYITWTAAAKLIHAEVNKK